MFFSIPNQVDNHNDCYGLNFINKIIQKIVLGGGGGKKHKINSENSIEG